MTEQPTTTRKPPARRWPWIVALAGVVIVAIIVALLFWPTNRPDSVETATSTPTASPSVTAAPSSVAPSASTADPVSPVADPAPTGCLAGQARTAQMVLDTIAKAPHTSNGAVEVAASIVRWMYQRPTPSLADAQIVQDAAVSGSTDSNFVEYFANDPALIQGTAGADEEFYLSTAPGVFLLESYSSTAASVSIGTGIVIDGSLSGTRNQSTTVSLQWENEGWRVADASGKREVDSLFAGGTPFAGGC